MSGITYLGGTLTALELVGNTFTSRFVISNVKLDGNTLTTDPSLWGGTGLTFPAGTAGASYLPFGTAGGYLWLMNSLAGVTITPLSPYAVSIPTNLQGNAGVTFGIPITSGYDYKLYYQKESGTRANALGFFNSDNQLVRSFDVLTDLSSDKGLFDVLTPQTVSRSGTTATIESNLFSYNTFPILNTAGQTISGQISVYKNSSSSGLSLSGGLTGVTGILITNYSTNNLSNARTVIPIAHGITFDTKQGDFYMAYYPNSSNRNISSRNYVAVPPINLPFTVGNTDFNGISGSTGTIGIALKDISYNFTPLKAGDKIVVSGPSLTTQELSVYLDNGIPSATFTSILSASNSIARFKSNNLTSNSFYTIPPFTPSSEEFNGTITKSNVTNNGFTLTLTNFDYFDQYFRSIFNSSVYPTPSTGYIRITGPYNFFKVLPYVPTQPSYSFNIDSSLPFDSDPALLYTFSFVDDTTRSVRSAVLTYSTYWRGVLRQQESFVVDGISNRYTAPGTTQLNFRIEGFDYLDNFANSIFNSKYLPIELASTIQGGNAYSSNSTNVLNGGNAFSSGNIIYASTSNPNVIIPPSGAQVSGTTLRSASLQQTDSNIFRPTTTGGSTGIQYFGVTGPTLFAVNSIATGRSSIGDAVTGTVISSSSTGLILNITDTTRNSSGSTGALNLYKYLFSGSYYDQPDQGNTGSIQLLGVSGSTLSVLNTTPYIKNNTGYTLTTSSILSNYFLGFYDNSTNSLRSSLYGITYTAPSTIYPQEFRGTAIKTGNTTINFTQFNYLVDNVSVVSGASGSYSNGFINLYDGLPGSGGTLLGTASISNGVSNFNIDFTIAIPTNAYLQYRGLTPSNNTFIGSTYKQLSVMSTTQTTNSGQSGPTFFGGWTGGSASNVNFLWNGVSGPSGTTGSTADFEFNYMYRANAARTTIYQLIAQVNLPLETSQTITVNIPANELSRMLVYQSAWDVIDPATGLPLQGFIGGGTYGYPGATITDPGPGFNSQGIYYGPTGLSGPNVALLLGSVLDAVNMFNGATLIQRYPVLTNIDNRFTSTNATQFRDDAGVTINSIVSLWNGMTFGSSGSSGSTGRTLLSIIPSEAISSISNSGMTITALKSVLTDIDTITNSSANYVPALSNIFAETAAYGRANSKNRIILSQTSGSIPTGFLGPSGPSGQTGGFALSPTIAQAWSQTGTNIYGVDFQPGDTLTLYVTYTFTKGRVYTIDPHVVTDLQSNYGFRVGNVASLTIGGVTVKLQKLNPDGSVDLSDPSLATDPTGGTQSRIFGIKLVASANRSFSNTRFSS